MLSITWMARVQPFLLIVIFFGLESVTAFNNEKKSSDNVKLYPKKPIIVGGVPTEYNEFPYMAALGWENDQGKLEYHCGGMLISPNMVLTAAHCVYLNGKQPDAVNIGGDSLPEEIDVIFHVHIKTVHIFPEYDSSQSYHDIAIVELADDVPQDTVCLWTRHNLPSKNLTAIGYGLTAFAGDMSPHLLKVNLTEFPETFCQPFFKRQRKFKAGISNSHICAGDMDRKKDTCQGDSGGPLLIIYESQPYAVGITSAGQACSGIPPAIYTRISSYIDWIKSVVMADRQDELGKYCFKNQPFY